MYAIVHLRVRKNGPGTHPIRLAAVSYSTEAEFEELLADLVRRSFGGRSLSEIEILDRQNSDESAFLITL